MRLLTTKRFEKDLKRGRKRGINLHKLWTVVEQLLSNQPLAPRYRQHRLAGDWSRCWECHIEPDWLLVWRREDDTLILIRTGTHADLFG
ncbi:MAG: type II toxin-antitoxin system YafQ family toxin [Candidatus Aminicenantes bacterium]|nr:type II toxin-antitoxin system YafQ family toxin [Candidatus Aminicenantes bacterium]